MTRDLNSRWVRLLQQRAERMAEAATTEPTPFIARELGALALRLDDMADRIAIETTRRTSMGKMKDDLIRHLETKAHGFARTAHAAADRAEAAQWHVLSECFGAEAAELECAAEPVV